jgi:hypothetical protein
MRTHKILSILILLIGVVLVIMPFAYQMFDRAAAGADMMQAFEPVLTRENVDTFKGHMQTFGGMQADMEKMLPAIAKGMNMTDDQLNQMLQGQFPGVATGMQQMDTMGADFNTVITVMDQNVENFQKANKLPMSALPWVFVIAGVLLIVLSGVQLLVPARS